MGTNMETGKPDVNHERKQENTRFVGHNTILKSTMNTKGEKLHADKKRKKANIRVTRPNKTRQDNTIKDKTIRWKEDHRSYRHNLCSCEI